MLNRSTRFIVSLLVGFAIAAVVSPPRVQGEQFLLFDRTFQFEEKDAAPTKSHLFVMGDQFGPETPSDWTHPIDYRNGTVYIRMEILEKPPGKVPTVWSLCYIPNKGQKNNYGCIGSPSYAKPGVYEKTAKMNEFWENDSIIWSEGIKKMSLVIKAAGKGGQGHAHRQPDLKQFFPTKLRVTMVQVSVGGVYDPAALGLPPVGKVTSEGK